MNKISSYETIASKDVMYSTPSQRISHESILSSSFKPEEFINFMGDDDSSSAGLQEYSYIDSVFNPRWRKSSR